MLRTTSWFAGRIAHRNKIRFFESLVSSADLRILQLYSHNLGTSWNRSFVVSIYGFPAILLNAAQKLGISPTSYTFIICKVC